MFNPANSLLGVTITATDVTLQKRLQVEVEHANQALETAYEELQSTNEELETTNEELQSTIEELETTNEELQSTNEDLETMNEELQSANEELQTSNDELQRRTGELNQVNVYLDSILTSLRLGVVVVDRELLVRVGNHKAEDLWGLRGTEVTDEHFLNLDIGLPVELLRQPIRACLAGETQHIESVVAATTRRGRAIACRVTCTPLFSTNTDIRGVVLLIEEDSPRRHSLIGPGSVANLEQGMDADTFSRQIESLQHRSAVLAAGAAPLVSDPVATQAVLAELASALEELRVADEDLREQHEAIAATREVAERGRQRYQELFELAPDAYFVTNTEGTIQEANQAAARLLGLSHHFLIGKPLAAFVLLDDRADFRTQLGRLPDDGVPRAWDMRLQPRRDAPIDVAVTVGVVEGPAGATSSVGWLLHDIRARRQAEQAIRTLNVDLERRVASRTADLAAANAAKDQVLVREGLARQAAEAAQGRLALLAEASALLSTSLDMRTILDDLAHLLVPALADYCLVVLGEDANALQLTAVAHHNPVHDRALSALVVPEQSIFVRADGQANVAWPQQLLNVLYTCQPLLSLSAGDLWATTDTSDDAGQWMWSRLGCDAWIGLPLVARGRPLGVMMLAIAGSKRTYTPTELVLGEELARRTALAIDNARLFGEARAALQVRDDFLASISHDLKTPLTGIKAVGQLLLRKLARGDSPDQAALTRALVTIDDTATKMAALIQELVGLSHYQTGRSMPLNHQPTDLVDLARRLVDQHQRSTERHRLHLTTTEDSLVGNWDAARLERVLDNLLTNAIKYSPSGGAVMVALACEPNATGDWATLVVQDEGLGIPAAEQPRLFERFFRASNVGASISGDGIGLATVRSIVEQHGGTVAVASDEGRGSTFSVRLPLHHLDVPVPARPVIPV